MAEDHGRKWRPPRKDDNPVLRWVLFGLCASAVLGGLLWKAMGW